MTSLLQAENLRVAYGSTQVLSGIGLNLQAGEVVGLVGPNGCGKSTLLRVLAGLQEATGDIVYGDSPLQSLGRREQAAHRAYLPQDSVETFGYRVAEMLAMAQAHRDPFFRAPVFTDTALAELLDELDLAGLQDRPYNALSGGERQRVDIARLLAQDAKVLLLDEPTSALDLMHQALVLRALRRRAQAGASVILAIHDLSLAARACDRLLLLSDGHVVADASPEDVLTSERIESVYGVSVHCFRDPHDAVVSVHLPREVLG